MGGLRHATSFGYFDDLRILSRFVGRAFGGQSRAQIRSNVAPGKVALSGPIARGGPAYRYGYPVYPYFYYYPLYYSPVLVISPYLQPYYVTPTIVPTMPYFCLFHNEDFVSRVGMLDHLAGTHKIPLDAAASLCPDGTGSCIFPSY